MELSRRSLAVGVWLLAFGLGHVDVLGQIAPDSRQLPPVFQTEAPHLLSKKNAVPRFYSNDWLHPDDVGATMNQGAEAPQTTLRYNLTPTVRSAHFGMFCKIELKLEKVTGIAPRFRLGSVDYVDRLEGKY
ncbi:MAG: hypothetical protein R3330_01255 [Saprospiraceae bacterium]|nr:hypothetical protein [Saprospiraceae bacterium]